LMQPRAASLLSTGDLGRLLLLTAWCVAVRLPTLIPSMIDWDESIYLLIADRWRLGELPYVGLWDHKPAGLYALIVLALAAFGRSVEAVRILAIGGVLVSALCVYGVCRHLSSNRRAAEGAALLVAPYSLLWGGTAANSEHLFIAANLVGLLLLLYSYRCGSQGVTAKLWLAGAALAFGIAIQIKYLAFVESAFMLVMFAVAQHRQDAAPLGRRVREALGVAVFLALPTLFVALYYASHGSLGAFIDANFLANLRHAQSASSSEPSPFVNAITAWAFHSAPLWVGAVALLGLCIAGRQRPLLTTPEWLCVAWLVVGLLEASATRQFYRHYFLVTLPPMCLLVMSLAARLPALGRAPWRIHVLALTLALGPLIAIGYKYYRPWIGDWLAGRPDEPARVVELMQPRLAPGETLYAVDAMPIVYFLANVPAPTRFAFPPFLIDPHFSAVAGVDHEAEVAAILAKTPRCVVLLIGSPSPRSLEVRQRLGAEYVRIESLETVDLLCRP
jgi:4-amino-4-deoxy-L-arabinose transferase-like glycosyltransferase